MRNVYHNEKEENNDRFHRGASSLYVDSYRDWRDLHCDFVGEEMMRLFPAFCLGLFVSHMMRKDRLKKPVKCSFCKRSEKELKYIFLDVDACICGDCVSLVSRCAQANGVKI
jgi:hypothetical protein